MSTWNSKNKITSRINAAQNIYIPITLSLPWSPSDNPWPGASFFILHSPSCVLNDPYSLFQSCFARGCLQKPSYRRPSRSPLQYTNQRVWRPWASLDYLERPARSQSSPRGGCTTFTRGKDVVYHCACVRWSGMWGWRCIKVWGLRFEMQLNGFWGFGADANRNKGALFN